MAGSSMGLRICFVSSHPPSRARLSEYAAKVLKELQKSSRISEIVVLTDSNTDEAASGYGSKIRVKKTWKPDSLLSIVKILVIILKLRPDVVHFNSHFQSFGRRRTANFVGLSLPFLCRILGVPSLVSIHNLADKVRPNAIGLQDSFLNRVGIRLATKLITSASAVAVTVNSYVQFLQQVYGCRNVMFVAHGTDVVHAENRPPTNQHKVILMFGHMSPYKRLQTMLKIFSRLSKERSDFRLVVAGGDHPNFPGYLDPFKRNPPVGVEFLGYIPEEDLSDLFLRAFVVVLPYLTGTGTSGVFHMACGFGRPVVASDLPEIRELVNEGASAILVSPNDVEGFCKAILFLSDNPQITKEMGRQNLLFASKETWSSVASSYEKIYLKLATH